MRPRLHLLSSSEEGSEAFQDFFISLKIGLNESHITRTNLLKKQKIESNKLVSRLSEILQELDHSQCNTLWKNINKICSENLRHFATCVSQEDETSNESLMKTIDILTSITFLCVAAIQLEEPQIPDDLLGCVLILHGSLPSFSSCAENLASSICKLCVEWWCKNFVSRENICLNALIYVLNEILGSGLVPKEKSSTSTTLTDLCQMQKAFLSFDFSVKEVPKSDGDGVDEASLQELKQLLTSAFLHPVFLKGKKGQKFLANVLLLDKSLLKTAHQAAVSNIFSHRKFAKQLGNIYYMTWTLADENIKETIEDICIQDLMYRAIHSSREKDLFSTFLSMISSITCHSGSLQVRHMLTKLYNPIIWRSLKASNAIVRGNAASLLFDVFPLMTPDLSGEEKDELLQRQFTAIDELVMDPVPQIRCIAILGLCKVLNLFWDVIPAEVIAVQARNLYTNMAFDASSVSVRAAVFKGTIILLNNPCSHPLLKKLLPLVGQCLHDTSDNVRLEVCNVLLAVKQTSTIQFWDVCSIETILPLLEVENPSGTKRLVKLLYGSFLPSDQPVQTWVERCVNFFKRSVGAARKFYLYAKDQLTAMEAGEFIYLISIFIFNHVSKSLEEQQEENETPNESSEPVIAEDSDAIAGLLETICIVWIEFGKKMKDFSSSSARRSAHSGPNSERELSKRIMLQLPRTTHVCFRKYHDERNLNVLLQLSSYLHPASTPIFSANVMPKLKSLPDDAPPSYYSMLIQCVISWGWSSKVLQLICDWLAEGIGDNEKDAPTEELTKRRSVRTEKKEKKSKSKGKSVQFNVAESAPRPKQALKYLSSYLGNAQVDGSQIPDEACKKILGDISLSLLTYTTELSNRLRGDSPPNTDITNDILVTALDLYFKLLRHSFSAAGLNKESDESSDELTPLKNIVEFAQVEVVGQLKLSSQAMETHNASMLSASLLRSEASTGNRASYLQQMALVRDCLRVCFPNILSLLKRGIPIAELALCFLAAFTRIEAKTVEYAGCTSGLLHEILEWNILYVWSKTESGDGLSEAKETLTEIFDDVLLALMIYSRSNPDGFHELFRTEVRSHIRSCFSYLFRLASGLTKDVYESFATKVMSAVLADIAHHMNAVTEFRSRENISDLPQFSSCFLSLVCATSPECHYICLNTLPKIFSSNDPLPENECKFKMAVQACTVLLNVLIKDGKNPSAAKECQETLQKRSEFAQLAQKLNESKLV